jgi:hypothetical protein
MVNTCEPAIKIVMRERAKVVVLGDPLREIRLRPKRQCGSERGLNATASWIVNPSVDSRYLTSHILQLRNVETPYASRARENVDEWTSREASRTACGLGMSEEANAAL